MNLEFVLPENLGSRLRAEAAKRRILPEKLAIELLEQSLPATVSISVRNQRAIAMFERWVKEDREASEEDRIRYRAVLAAIDEDRPSYRKLFEKVLAEETE